MIISAADYSGKKLFTPFLSCAIIVGGGIVMEYIVKRIIVGALETNCYIVKHADSRGAMVIDPGGDAIFIKSTLLEMDAYASVILLTHGHFDHILALDELRTAKTTVCMHSADAHMLVESDLIPANCFNVNPWPFKPADILFSDSDRHATVNGFDFEIIHTPGHTEGSVCYLFGDLLFTGDTLFCNGIGRTDFKGGDSAKMKASLKLLYSMPGDYAVYPGHDRETTLEQERRHNPYLKREA